MPNLSMIRRSPRGFAVWLCSGQADWAKDRYPTATWDVGNCPR